MGQAIKRMMRKMIADKIPKTPPKPKYKTPVKVAKK